MTDPKPDFSDVTGGSSSTAPSGPAYNLYTIVSGDTLSKIAKRSLGDASKWKLIFEANRDVIKDPDKIFPGQKIKIPTNKA